METVSTKLEGIAKVDQMRPREKFTSLAHLINFELRGYYGYYGITDNIIMLKKIREEIKKMLHKLLNRRSREHYLDWEAFKQLSKFFPIAKPRITVSIFELRQERGYIL